MGCECRKMSPVFKDKEVVLLSSCLESTDKVLAEVFEDVNVSFEQADVWANVVCKLHRQTEATHYSTRLSKL